MSRIIGIEESLSNVEDALRAKGYQVVQLRTEEDARKCDCCIVTGQDNNFMGISDIETAGSVIDARGLSADEVCQHVDTMFS